MAAVFKKEAGVTWVDAAISQPKLKAEIVLSGTGFGTARATSSAGNAGIGRVGDCIGRGSRAPGSVDPASAPN